MASRGRLELFDPETMHDMPVLVARLGHRLVDVEKSAGEFKFVIEVCS